MYTGRGAMQDRMHFIVDNAIDAEKANVHNLGEMMCKYEYLPYLLPKEGDFQC
jgi:hypothetical protein